MLTDQLRKAVHDSGLSLYRIAKDSGVPFSTVHRFYTGGDMRLSNAERIAEVVGLAFTSTKRIKKTGRKGGVTPKRP